MIEKFKDNLQRLTVDNKNKKYILGVSGGPDSVALLLLAKEAKLDVLVAHCNFNLRGAGSDNDENFTKDLAEKLKVEFIKKDFATKEYANDKGISVQMAARELRYAWFDELLSLNKRDYILIAHNKGDVAETLLINQIRGCGIRGLAGIPEKNGSVIRPMLNMSREEIVYYLTKKDQDYRTDRSNLETKYLRNSIRHNVILELKDINPEIEDTLKENADRVRRSVVLFDELLKKEKDRIFKQCEDGIKIYYELANEDLLYELLRDYGFNYSSVKDLYSCKSPGKQVKSDCFLLQADRGVWWLRKIANARKSNINIEISDFDFDLKEPIELKSKHININDFKINPDSSIAQLDADNVKLPIILRTREKGDRFKPLGMSGFQKLSDFFVNNKLNAYQKDKVLLLCSGDDIVWVVGMQIDDRYKVTKHTRNVLEIKLISG